MRACEVRPCGRHRGRPAIAERVQAVLRWCKPCGGVLSPEAVTCAGSGSDQGRREQLGSCCRASQVDGANGPAVSPVSVSRFGDRCTTSSLSAGDGFMITMAAAPTDITAVISGDPVVRPARRRGRSKAPNFKYDGPVAVIRLELDVADARVRQRLERQWAAVFRLRRALQRDAAARCRAYWAARRERSADPKALRERLGLSRKAV